MFSYSNEFRKHNIIVLSDEIYGQLTFSNNHIPLSKVSALRYILICYIQICFIYIFIINLNKAIPIQFYPDGTITTSGFSKWSSAGGWRVGYMIVPSEQKALFNALKAAGTHTFTCAPSPIQHALAEVVYCVYLYTIFYY